MINRMLNMGTRRRQRADADLVRAIRAVPVTDDLPGQLDDLREAVADGTPPMDHLPEVFALVVQAVEETLGLSLHDEQLLGGIALARGQVAEMQTGEGKTVTAVAPAVLHALAGRGVHVVTVNDYLAERDAAWMRPVYEALGVRIGVILPDIDLPARTAAHQAEITYGTNSEFGFDYLRDHIAPQPRLVVSREPHYAIVDEVDNILIDEARTPMIISGNPQVAADLYRTFAGIVDGLTGRALHEIEQEFEAARPGRLPVSRRLNRDVAEGDWDYDYDVKMFTAAPSARGIAHVERALGIAHLYRPEHVHLVNHLIQACKAKSLYHRDRQYSIVDDEVVIIDENTGRLMPGRRWSDGLHQAIEAKEGLPVGEEFSNLAQITVQNFFRRYERLAGMTGTAATEASEFGRVYGLDVRVIPPHRPRRRIDEPDRIYRTREDKLAAAVAEVAERHATGQPVLLGTATVEHSQELSVLLAAAGIRHRRLDARPEHVAAEAETIAQAGRIGAVTIATNMAGRGVDIRLGGDPEQLLADRLRSEGLEDKEYEARFTAEIAGVAAECALEGERVRALGGLAVVATERHDSRRIDNQLRGRSGRQGEPGSSVFLLSTQDDLLALFGGGRVEQLMGVVEKLTEPGRPIQNERLSRQIDRAQQRIEENNALARARVLEFDDVLGEQREVIYAYRRTLLHGRDLADVVEPELRAVAERFVEDRVDDFAEVEALASTWVEAAATWPIAEPDSAIPSFEDVGDLAEALAEALVAAYGRQVEALGRPFLAHVERQLLIAILDEFWQHQLSDMEALKDGIGWQSLVNVKPIVAYQREGYAMFSSMMGRVWDAWTEAIFHLEGDIESARAILDARALAGEIPDDERARG